jgi:hypothetical protein
MNTLQDLRRHLQDSFDTISAVWQYGDWFEGLDAIGLAEEACRLACRFGCDVPMTTAKTPQEALRVVGRLLAWAEQDWPFVPPEMMTQEDLIRYLRLDVDERNPVERVRNLIRRQGLPVVRRGRLLLFRKAAVDQWLDLRSRPNYAGGRSGGCPADSSRKERA